MKKTVIIVALIALLLSGCAPTRILYREMPTEESESAIIKQGLPFNKKPIVGKGWEAEVRGQIEAKVTTKDGTIVEIKTIKASIFEKMFGWLYIIKPNNISTGSK